MRGFGVGLGGVLEVGRKGGNISPSTIEAGVTKQERKGGGGGGGGRFAEPLFVKF